MSDATLGLGTVLAIAGPAMTPIEVIQETGSTRPIRGMCGQPLDLPEGRYWVQAVLPGAFGRTQTTDAQQIEVKAGTETRVIFEETAPAPPQPPPPPTAPPPPQTAPPQTAPRTTTKTATTSAAVGIAAAMGSRAMASILSAPPPRSPLVAPPRSPLVAPPRSPLVAPPSLAPLKSSVAPFQKPIGAIVGMIGSAAASLAAFVGRRYPSNTAGIRALMVPVVIDAPKPIQAASAAIPVCRLDSPEPTLVSSALPFLRINAPDQNWLGIIPTLPNGSTAVSAAGAADKAQPTLFPHLTLRFPNPDLDRLWQFANTRAMTDARAVAQSLIATATGLPAITAALACYVLLRVEWDENLLHVATAQLEADPDAPDLWAIQAELLSRLGRHDEAAQSLLKLGLGPSPWPFFRPGIEYARQRARRCLSWDSSPDRAEMTRVVSGLTQISTAMNPDPLYLVLRNPDSPALSALYQKPV